MSHGLSFPLRDMPVEVKTWYQDYAVRSEQQAAYETLCGEGGLMDKFGHPLTDLRKRLARRLEGYEDVLATTLQQVASMDQGAILDFTIEEKDHFGLMRSVNHSISSLLFYYEKWLPSATNTQLETATAAVIKGFQWVELEEKNINARWLELELMVQSITQHPRAMSLAPLVIPRFIDIASSHYKMSHIDEVESADWWFNGFHMYVHYQLLG